MLTLQHLYLNRGDRQCKRCSLLYNLIPPAGGAASTMTSPAAKWSSILFCSLLMMMISTVLTRRAYDTRILSEKKNTNIPDGFERTTSAIGFSGQVDYAYGHVQCEGCRVTVGPRKWRFTRNKTKIRTVISHISYTGVNPSNETVCCTGSVRGNCRGSSSLIYSQFAVAEELLYLPKRSRQMERLRKPSHSSVALLIHMICNAMPLSVLHPLHVGRCRLIRSQF